jgi:hypothetical protein
MLPLSRLLSRSGLLAAALAIGAASVAVADGAATDNAKEAPFLAENDAAMTKMMADMTIKPSGDVDRDFVAMMVPHHQGAIDMAQAVLRYGHNEQLRRLAQEIVVTQLQEIAAMRLAVGEPLPPSVPSPTQPSPPPAASPKSMSPGPKSASPGAMNMKMP